MLEAIITAMETQTSIRRQALNSEVVRRGIMDILLNSGGLYEALRAQSTAQGA